MAKSGHTEEQIVAVLRQVEAGAQCPQAVLPPADLFHQLLCASRAFGLAVRRDRFGPMPSADSRCTLRTDRSILSRDSATCGGSPEVSSTAFSAKPPDLPPVLLVEVGFAVICQLAPHRRPHHPVLVHRLALLIHASFGPRLATTPLRFSSLSPPPGWAGDFHSQAVEHVRHTNKKPPFQTGAF